MNTLKDYISDIRRMFFISVDADIDSWSESTTLVGDNDKIYKGPYLGYYNYLYIDISSKELKIHIKENNFDCDKIISSYTRFFWSYADKELYNYVKKLENHFEKLKQDKKDNYEIESIKIGLKHMQLKYPKEYEKEIRKEKLEKLNK